VVLLQDVIRVHTGVESTVVIRQVPSADSDSMRTVLRESRLHSTSRFFVHLSSTDTALFLKAVIYIHTLLSLSAQNISHLTLHSVPRVCIWFFSVCHVHAIRNTVHVVLLVHSIFITRLHSFINAFCDIYMTILLVRLSVGDTTVLYQTPKRVVKILVLPKFQYCKN